MKKHLVIAVAIAALAAAGCKEKPKEIQQVAPQSGMSVPQAQSAQPIPPGGVQGGNPHAGIKMKEIPAGTGHKGKVVSTMDAAGYTYIEVQEKGQKIWVATMQTKVKVGDEVEFLDSPPMVNFTSRTLKRTFDRIIFVDGIRVSSK